MGAPLSDITIYYEGLDSKEAPETPITEARTTINYVCDFYHKMLMGYKPPKTGRICIHLAKEKKWDETWYFGSICHISGTIDENKYLSADGTDRLKYILEILHQLCLELCNIYSWNKEIFERSYHKMLDQNFIFIFVYPFKKSVDKRIMARVVIEKTIQTSTLFVEFVKSDTTKKILLFAKRNWYWYDTIYDLAKNAKWLTKNAYGVSSKRTRKFGYYSIEDDIIIGDLKFTDIDF